MCVCVCARVRVRSGICEVEFLLPPARCYTSRAQAETLSSVEGRFFHTRSHGERRLVAVEVRRVLPMSAPLDSERELLPLLWNRIAAVARMRQKQPTTNLDSSGGQICHKAPKDTLNWQAPPPQPPIVAKMRPDVETRPAIFTWLDGRIRRSGRYCCSTASGAALQGKR